MSVVVGVSPTTGSPAALRWAADEARLRGVGLRAVMAWRTPRPGAATAGIRPPAGTDAPAEDYAFEAESRLRDFVRTALGSDEAVEYVVTPGSEVNALLSAAQDAHLLVVGEPRPGRLASMFSSLTAPQVVLRAECPVVVMPSAVALGAG